MLKQINMNTKHTPAPWFVNPKAKTNIRHGNLTIANCSSTHDGSREEEEIANAKLIAAAPELLDFVNRICGEMLRNDFCLDERWEKQGIKLIQKATE